MVLPIFERRYASGYDGTRLEIQTFGRGERTIVIANGLGGTLLAWAPLLRELEDEFRFVSWDYRGLYNSGPPAIADRLDVVDHVADMQVVMDATGTDSAIIAGWSMGVQVCVQASTDLRDRIDGVILINGTYGRVFDTAFPVPGTGLIFPWVNRAIIAASPALPPLVRAATKFPHFVSLMEKVGLVDEHLDQEVFVAIAKGFERLDFRVYHQIMQRLHDHDGEPLLADLVQPLLLVVGERDAMTPPSVRRVFEKHVAHCETFSVPRGTHYSLIEYPELVVGRIKSFLGEHFAPTAKKAS
jgi:pimeloyl-ACP methyl ester carboxylesterase